MYVFFVDLGVVVCVDTERVIWDFDIKIREMYCSSSWSWNKKSCLRLGVENYGGLGLGLGLDIKVLFTSLQCPWRMNFMQSLSVHKRTSILCCVLFFCILSRPSLSQLFSKLCHTT